MLAICLTIISKIRQSLTIFVVPLQNSPSAQIIEMFKFCKVLKFFAYFSLFSPFFIFFSFFPFFPFFFPSFKILGEAAAPSAPPQNTPMLQRRNRGVTEKTLIIHHSVIHSSFECNFFDNYINFSCIFFKNYLMPLPSEESSSA